MSRPETWYTGTLSIRPPLPATLADELDGIWTVTTDAIQCQDGQRDSEHAESNLTRIVRNLTTQGWNITGTIDWEWQGDGYYFGQFVMIDNRLHHRRGELILGAPEPLDNTDQPD